LALQTKNKIVAANLRLVVSSARRHLPSAVLNSTARLMDMISDGNIALMRAVDAFDIHRGSRFSTYASLSIMKEFAHCAARRGRRSLAAAPLLEDPPDSRGLIPGERIARRNHVQHLLLQLEESERAVLQAHFGLDEERGATYAQVARQLGLSKERVRQIEQNAMEKLRNCEEENPTG
jgi:RNA polymerase sigma factor (sigma-70 family)